MRSGCSTLASQVYDVVLVGANGESWKRIAD